VVVLVGFRTSSATAPTVTYGGVPATHLASYDSVTIRVAAFYVLDAQLPSPGTGKSVSIDLPGVTRGYAVCVPLRGAKQEAPAQNGGSVVATGIGPTSVTVSDGGVALPAVFTEHDEARSQ
jgi:hypothetical protein